MSVFEVTTDGMPENIRPKKGSKYDELKKYIDDNWEKLLEGGLVIKYGEPGTSARILNNRLNHFFRNNPPSIPVGYHLQKVCKEDIVYICVAKDED